MPRTRKDPALAWLPQRVYVHAKNYVYQPKSGGKIILCSLTENQITVLNRWKEVSDKNVGKRKDFETIVNNFFKSPSFNELSSRTQRDYFSYKVTISGVFGKMLPNNIAPHNVRQFMDALATARAKNGKRANPTANRHKACLQKICSWALQTGLMKTNPCVGVTKLREESRTRYITDMEYEKIFDSSKTLCKAAMELAYLCMARIEDVTTLELSALREEGIFIRQGKTKKEQIKSWSPRLKSAVTLAKSLPLKDGVTRKFLLSKPDGSRYSKRSIQAQYKMATDTAGIEGCTFHDLKAKGISDYEGTLEEKRHTAGHSSIKQTASYDRKIQIVKPVK